MARVNFGRKSSGWYFNADQCVRNSVLLFWWSTVNTRAIDFRTTLIFANLEAAPPVTLATRSWANSVFSSINCRSRSGWRLLRRS